MNAADLDLRERPARGLHPGLGLHPGESDPAGMLGGVLVLLMALAVIAALGLAWWLA